MKHTLPLLLAFCVLFSGCLSVKTTHSFNGVPVERGRTPLATVEIENSGWYLLTFLPIASGDTAHPNDSTCLWFTDTVKLENNLKVLAQVKQKERAREVANLTSHRSDEKYLVCLLARRAFHTSAVLLKPEVPSPQKAEQK